MRRKKRLDKQVVIGLSVLALLAFPCQSFADSMAWYLNQSNEFADGEIYGTVAIDANPATGLVQFTVTPTTPAVYGTLGDNFGIQQFGFNFANITSAPGAWLPLNLPTGWEQGSGRMDGFGVFLVNETGDGKSRQDPLVFSFTLPEATEANPYNFAVLSTGTAGQGNFEFSAHVAGFGAGPGSHYIAGGPPVPAPGAALLGALGLGFVGWCRRRFA